jgi:RHS repeat-associated protein
MPTGVTWSGEVNGHVEVEYDNNFRVWRQTVNGGIDARYYYDHDGLLTLAGDMSITRDPQNGRLTGTQFGYVTTSQTYNSAGELATYEAKFRENTLFATTYTRDSLGRITQLDETVQGVSKTFRYAYDATGRLQKMWRNDTLISTYTYDSNGNRLSHTSLTGTVAGTYDSQDRLLTYGSTKYLYTTNGELQAKIDGNGTTRYTYDAFGNLVQVRMPRQKDGGQANGDVIEYVIDGQNRRVGKRLNGTLVKGWLYEGQLRPVAELDAAGNVTARYMYGAKVNVPEYIVKNTVTYRVITDHLGSVRLVVDQTTGWVAQRMDYDEWGNVLGDSNPDFTPFGFAGGMHDQQSKLIRFGARDYDPTAASWTARDPIGLKGGANVYAYVSSDPVNSIDRSGSIKLHAERATKEQIAVYSNAYQMVYQAVYRNPKLVEYFSRFGLDIKMALCPGVGPDVYLTPLVNPKYGEYNWRTNSLFLEKFYSEQEVAATFIHELAHWANDYGSWFGNVNPDVSDIRFKNPNPDDGPYGYAAQVVMFGRAW